MSHHAAGYFLSHAKAFELCDLACLFWEFFPVTSFPETSSLCLCCSFSLSPDSFQVSGLNISPFWVGFCVKWESGRTPWFPYFRGNAAGAFSVFSVMTPGLPRSPYVVAHSSCPCFFRAFIPGRRTCDGGLLCISWIVMWFLSLGMFVCAVCCLWICIYWAILGSWREPSLVMVYDILHGFLNLDHRFFFFILRIFNSCVL